MARPPFDPWLADLRRDRRNLPVPYVNRWGPEDTTRMSVRVDPHVGVRAVFLDDSRETVPDFTRQHMARQRQCMALGLCQVCGRQTPWSRRNLIIAPATIQWITVDGREVPVTTEPWLDDRCAAIATTWCPELIRRDRDEDLTVVPVRSPREISTFLSTGCVDGHLAAETRNNPVAMWVKVGLHTVNIVREETPDGVR